MTLLNEIFLLYKQILQYFQESTLENSALSVLLIWMAISSIVYWKFYKDDKKYKLPPGPQGVPVFGYLPYMSKEPFKDFHSLVKEYGNVFRLRLGQTNVVILGDYEAVKDAFSKSTTTDRPERIFDIFPDGVGFSSVNGNEWVEQRKYCVKAMRELGLGGSKWEGLVQEEVEDFTNLVHSFKGKPININRILTLSVSNNISSLVFGKRLPSTEENIDFLNSVFDKIYLSCSQADLRIYFPYFFDLLDKCRFAGPVSFPKEFRDFNNYVRKEVELHKASYIPGSTDNFIDGYLTEMQIHEERKFPHTFNEVNLRGNVQAIFLGGSDTTRTSLTWLLLCMANYADVQDKVHQELDTVLGKDGKITWSEKSIVPYTYAVIMEGQRWRTIAPLNTSRIASEDIEVQGYDIPKGWTMIANNWGIHNDVRYWKEPHQFMPERFLSEDGKHVIYKNDSYVPFSYGKRECPGETIGMMEILYYFVSLMQNFDVKPPEGKVPQMDGLLGLTYQTIPQDLRFISRK